MTGVTADVSDTPTATSANRTASTSAAAPTRTQLTFG